MNIYEKGAESKHLPQQHSPTQAEKTADQVEHITLSTHLQTFNLDLDTLHNLQKQDKFCKDKVKELQQDTNSTFYLDSNSILKHKVIINNPEM